MKKFAQFIKILGDANRLTIIRVIGRESLSVTEIINSTGLSQTLVSFHLRVLRDSGVVVTRRDGPFIFYSLSDVSLIDILGELAQLVDLKNEFSASMQLTTAKKAIGVQRR